jgi:hypothetical protein
MFSIFDGHIDSHIGGMLPLDHSLDGVAADAGIHHSLDGEAAGTGGGILFVLTALYKFWHIKVNPTEVIVHVLGILGFQGGGPHGPIDGG